MGPWARHSLSARPPQDSGRPSSLYRECGLLTLCVAAQSPSPPVPWFPTPSQLRGPTAAGPGSLPPRAG